MTRTRSITAFALLLTAAATTTTARADGLLFGYEGDVLPESPTGGFAVFDACNGDCSRRLEAGHFILEWGVMGNAVNYSHTIAGPGDPPPPRCGWSGASGPINPSHRSLRDAMLG